LDEHWGTRPSDAGLPRAFLYLTTRHKELQRIAAAGDIRPERRLCEQVHFNLSSGSAAWVSTATFPITRPS